MTLHLSLPLRRSKVGLRISKALVLISAFGFFLLPFAFPPPYSCASCLQIQKRSHRAANASADFATHPCIHHPNVHNDNHAQKAARGQRDRNVERTQRRAQRASLRLRCRAHIVHISARQAPRRLSAAAGRRREKADCGEQNQFPRHESPGV
jgi:hypothetical protein